VDDCTDALYFKPQYLKALIRRCQALEKQDKLEDALTGTACSVCRFLFLALRRALIACAYT
jgi:hypothetical protein